MPDWFRRTTIGAVGSCVAVALAGCVHGSDGGSDGGVDLDQPEYDCSHVGRPEPAAPEDPDAISPVSYPDSPDDPGTDAELTEYVSRFEKSYRRNRLIQSRGPDLRKFGFIRSCVILYRHVETHLVLQGVKRPMLRHQLENSHVRPYQRVKVGGSKGVSGAQSGYSSRELVGSARSR